MPDHFQHIYHNQPEDYQRLVAVEDYQGNLLHALRTLHPFTGATVAEWGAGTGRVTTLLAPYAARIVACDASAAMLGVARRHTRSMSHVHLAQADHQTMPLPPAIADVAIEGWAFGHYRFWNADTWQADIDRALAEMMRILKPGGTVILIETLGTGFEEPNPPAELAEVFTYVQDKHGFERKWCRTDYRFPDESEAQSLIRFFFQDGVTPAIVVPECTGIWWKVVA